MTADHNLKEVIERVMRLSGLCNVILVSFSSVIPKECSDIRKSLVRGLQESLWFTYHVLTSLLFRKLTNIIVLKNHNQNL